MALDFFEFSSGDFQVLLGDLFTLKLFPEAFDLVVFEGDVSLDILFGGVEHSIISSILFITELIN